MSIVRGARPETGWYALDKRISEDARLSWAARGLLVFLLGKPDHWVVSVEHLRKQTEGARVRTGRDGIYALLAELQGAGYVHAKQNRKADGTLGPMEYQVREVASPLPAEPDTATPLPAEPLTAEATLAKNETAATTEGKQKARQRAVPVAITLPDWVPADAWTAWLAARTKARKPATERAQELALVDLEELRQQGQDPLKVLEQSIKNSWAGLFRVKGEFSGGSYGGSAGRGSGRESLVERAERINREHDEREHRPN